MKKILILFIVLVCIGINTYEALNFKECLKEISVDNLNSKQLVNYLKEQEWLDKISKVCSENLCSSINVFHLEQDIKNFLKQNYEKLKSIDNDYALEAELKGFRIDKIILNACE